MTEYKFGEEVECSMDNRYWHMPLKFAGYGAVDNFVAVSPDGFAHEYRYIRRPRKLVKARFQAMIDKGDKAAEKIFMIRDYHADEYVRNGHKRAGDVMEFEFDISEQS